jgi:hypothetical protein
LQRAEQAGSRQVAHEGGRGKIPSVRGQALGAKDAYGIGRGGLDAKAFIAWALVGIPLAWGVWKTLENAAKILQ